MSTFEDFDLGLLDLPVLPSTADGSGASTPNLFPGTATMSPTGFVGPVDYQAPSPGFLDWSPPAGASSQFLLDLCVNNIAPPAPTTAPTIGAEDTSCTPPTGLDCEGFLGLIPTPVVLPQALQPNALFAPASDLVFGTSAELSPVNSTGSLTSVSAPNTSSGIKREVSLVSEDATEGESSGSSGEEPRKKPPRKHKKPRISELSEEDAIAKRRSNRESARKSRARKRERLDNVFIENETLKKENMELRLRLQMLMTSMIMSQTSLSAASSTGELV